MTIELDTTLAQAEVLYLSFSQLVADIDRRRAEDAPLEVEVTAPRLRKQRTGDGGSKQSRSDTDAGTPASPPTKSVKSTVALPEIGENLRELLQNGR